MTEAEFLRAGLLVFMFALAAFLYLLFWPRFIKKRREKLNAESEESTKKK